MEWIFLSPHLDDVALSCGGLVWTQANAGDKVSIWTICAGDPPPGNLSAFAESVHRRWETQDLAVEIRRSEDRLSCQRLGATPHYLSIPDAIYRKSPEDSTALYDTEQSLFGDIHPQEKVLIEDLLLKLRQELHPITRLICPMALGGHVDHRLVRAAAEGLGLLIWYYADYPYVIDNRDDLQRETQHLHKEIFSITTPALEAWINAVAAHASQISTFWQDLSSMESAIRDYHQAMGGICLWQKM